MKNYGTYIDDFGNREEWKYKNVVEAADGGAGNGVDMCVDGLTDFTDWVERKSGSKGLRKVVAGTLVVPTIAAALSSGLVGAGAYSAKYASDKLNDWAYGPVEENEIEM